MTSQIIAETVAAENTVKGQTLTADDSSQRRRVEAACWAFAAVGVLVVSLVAGNPVAAILLAIVVVCHVGVMAREDTANDGDATSAGCDADSITMAADYYFMP